MAQRTLFSMLEKTADRYLVQVLKILIDAIMMPKDA
jgi:hypothetical protein